MVVFIGSALAVTLYFVVHQESIVVWVGIGRTIDVRFRYVVFVGSTADLCKVLQSGSGSYGIIHPKGYINGRGAIGGERSWQSTGRAEQNGSGAVEVIGPVGIDQRQTGGQIIDYADGFGRYVSLVEDRDRKDDRISVGYVGNRGRFDECQVEGRNGNGRRVVVVFVFSVGGVASNIVVGYEGIVGRVGIGRRIFVVLDVSVRIFKLRDFGEVADLFSGDAAVQRQDDADIDIRSNGQTAGGQFVALVQGALVGTVGKQGPSGIAGSGQRHAAGDVITHDDIIDRSIPLIGHIDHIIDLTADTGRIGLSGSEPFGQCQVVKLFPESKVNSQVGVVVVFRAVALWSEVLPGGRAVGRNDHGATQNTEGRIEGIEAIVVVIGAAGIGTGTADVFVERFSGLKVHRRDADHVGGIGRKVFKEVEPVTIGGSRSTEGIGRSVAVGIDVQIDLNPLNTGFSGLLEAVVKGSSVHPCIGKYLISQNDTGPRRDHDRAAEFDGATVRFDGGVGIGSGGAGFVGLRGSSGYGIPIPKPLITG